MYWNEEENMLSFFPESGRPWTGDRLARSITSVSTFNIRFTAFFIAVPATRDHPVKVLVEPLIPSCPLLPQLKSAWQGGIYRF